MTLFSEGGRLTLFFDRSIGKGIPRALDKHLRPPVNVEYHAGHFDQAADDDVWLPEVGKRGWFVVGHDHSYHEKPNELAAWKTYSVGVFYLWGCEATKWETMRCFARAYDRIVAAAETTTRPFLYHVRRNGRIDRGRLPEP